MHPAAASVFVCAARWRGVSRRCPAVESIGGLRGESRSAIIAGRSQDWAEAWRGVKGGGGGGEGGEVVGLDCDETSEWGKGGCVSG